MIDLVDSNTDSIVSRETIESVWGKGMGEKVKTLASSSLPIGNYGSIKLSTFPSG
jgi:hypothetical protein